MPCSFAPAQIQRVPTKDPVQLAATIHVLCSSDRVLCSELAAASPDQIRHRPRLGLLPSALPRVATSSHLKSRLRFRLFRSPSSRYRLHTQRTAMPKQTEKAFLKQLSSAQINLAPYIDKKCPFTK